MTECVEPMQVPQAVYDLLLKSARKDGTITQRNLVRVLKRQRTNSMMIDDSHFTENYREEEPRQKYPRHKAERPSIPDRIARVLCVFGNMTALVIVALGIGYVIRGEIPFYSERASLDFIMMMLVASLLNIVCRTIAYLVCGEWN